MAMKRYFVFHKPLALLKSDHQIAYCHIQVIHWESLTHVQRCSRCIMQPKPIGPPGHSLGEFYSCTEMQSVYSAAKAD